MSKKIEQYFKDFSNSKKVFETTDGTLFHQHGDASLFQSSIDKNGQVKTHFRSDNTEEVSENVDEETETGETAKKTAKKTAAKKNAGQKGGDQ